MKYSFVVTIYNDGELAADFCRELEKAFRAYTGLEDIREEVEVVFVDDGSREKSLRALKETVDEFPFTVLVALARNFGQHVAISAGYRHARGEYVGLLNVDQEDPPDQLIVLLDALKAKDFDIVGGLYERRNIPIGQKITSYLFTTTLNRLTGYEVPRNQATVRVMTRRFIDAYNALTEKSRYIPGLEQWLGFKYGYATVRHKRRTVGKSSYNFSRRMRLALDSIISFSDFPLRLAVKFGFWVAALGVCLVMALIVDRLFFQVFQQGWVSTIVAIVLLGGVQIMVTGLVSLYVGRILVEVQGRPLFVVRETYRAASTAQAPGSPPA
jgi:glycosyltransferase involved in cell wall biosynthesis